MSPQQSIFDPGRAAFGGGGAESVLHPLVIASILLIGLLIFWLPRRQILFPLLLGLLLIPAGQNLYLVGNHLYVYRILLLFGWARVLLSKRPPDESLLPGGLGTLDKIFLVWATYRAFAVVALFMQAGAIPNQIAFLWDAIGGYFLLRCLIRDDEDALRTTKALAVVAIIVAGSMVFEQVTHRNMFGFLGGISPVPDTRAGRIRSQGVFEQPLLAGAFGATMFPLFLWMWKRGKSWILGILGTISTVIIAYTSATSTSIMALAGGIGVLFLWPMRKKMRAVRWGIVIGIVALQLVMKAPFWFVMAHIDVAGGSSGWDRANLVDNFVRNFRDWFLIGTHNNVNWGWDMWDTCNQFVTEGVSGGLVSFVTFIAMFVVCFRWIGNARKAVEGDRDKEWLFWLMGATLFAQLLAYFGIDYFDQMKFVWYALLAMISAVTLSSRAVTVTAPRLVLGRGAGPYRGPVPVMRRGVPEPKLSASSRAKFSAR
jgi:hypothetical protein